jgi:MoaA/NifB/PqqE/SkfB family radical SAM enzyme
MQSLSPRTARLAVVSSFKPSPWRKMRYLCNFLAGKLIHTNLQLLYQCNFRCKICDFWKPGQQRTSALTLQQVESISNKLATIGPQIVSIGGGEPLMHPQIVEVVRALERHHFPVMICNGWFVTPTLSRQLWEAGIYEVSVSVDYLDPRKHDEQRGVPGAHAKAIEALRILHETRAHPDQRVHMISVVLEDNLDDIEPLVELCASMGITYLVTLYSEGRGQRSVRPIPKDVSQRLLALKRKHSTFVALRGYLAEFSRAVEAQGIGPCNAGKQLCNIDSQGQVGLCIDRIDSPVGNILTDDMRELRARLCQLHKENTCHSCWTSCRGNIQAMRHGIRFVGNAWDYWKMCKAIPIAPSTQNGPS